MRPSLPQEYIRLQAEMLHMTCGVDLEQAKAFVQQTIKSRFKDRNITIQSTIRYGEVAVVNTKLSAFVEKHRKHVITPSGSVYLTSDEKTSELGLMIDEQLKLRKQYKKEMFIAKKNGDDAKEMINFQLQTLMKILMNSMPGGFAYENNVFYDRGGYNSITSLARAMISVGYGYTERFLGGVFGWFNEEQLINFITATRNNAPSDDKIAVVVNKYNLMVPTKQQLMSFFLTTVRQYQPVDQPFKIVELLVDRLTDMQRVYLYYYSNFKHLLQDNPQLGKNWISSCVDITGEDVPVEQIDVNSFSEELATMGACISQSLLKGEKYTDVLYNNEHPLHYSFINIINRLQNRTRGIDDLTELFIYHKDTMPDLNLFKRCIRQSVIVSDTDSDIFTLQRWVDWMLNTLNDFPEGLKIASHMIYLLSTYLRHELAKFSAAHTGGTGENSRLQMKNEFVYPVMITFDVKKHYASLQAIQEGMVLPKLETEIKGVGLRGSIVSPRALEEFKKWVEELLTESVGSQISAVKYIEKVVNYEKEIRASLMRGESEFLSITSVGFMHDYAKPWSSAYFYYQAWEDIFGDKYGHVHVPLKIQTVKLLASPPKEYFDWLKKFDVDIYNRWQRFVSKYKKHPPTIVINPQCSRIPEELIKIINYREIIYPNMRPYYLVLEALGIGVGYAKRNVLLSDIY